MSRFCKAVANAEGLDQNHCHRGLRALGSNSSKIQPADTRKLTGSIDLDAALKETYPEGPRWDYGVGYDLGGREAAYWIEVHPADTSKVREVIHKLEWLKGFLKRNNVLWNLTRNADNPYRWVASGRVNIPKTSKEFRLLSQNGLSPPQSSTAIP